MGNSDDKNINSNSKDKKANEQEPSFDVPSVFMNSHISAGKIRKNLDEILPENNYKKIVVYIYGKDNIDYINKISSQERNKVINSILDIGRTKSLLQVKRDFIRNYILQFLIIILTTTLAIPLVLTVINKSYQVTLSSYKFSEDNFRKLYKDKHIPLPKEKKRDGYIIK